MQYHKDRRGSRPCNVDFVSERPELKIWILMELESFKALLFLLSLFFLTFGACSCHISL